MNCLYGAKGPLVGRGGGQRGVQQGILSRAEHRHRQYAVSPSLQRAVGQATIVGARRASGSALVIRRHVFNIQSHHNPTRFLTNPEVSSLLCCKQEAGTRASVPLPCSMHLPPLTSLLSRSAPLLGPPGLAQAAVPNLVHVCTQSINPSPLPQKRM
eukprot:353273-Chlamydomonas_euryale.AAC.2